MKKYNLFQTGTLSLLLLAACQSGVPSAHVLALRKEQDSLTYQFEQKAEQLRQRSVHFRSEISSTAQTDSILLKQLALLDKKIAVYQDRFTNSSDSFHQIIRALQAGKITVEEAQKKAQAHKTDFAAYDDAMNQLNAYIERLSLKSQQIK